MLEKIFNVKLDILGFGIQKTNIEVVQGDKNTNKFLFTLYKGTSVFALTDVSYATITIRRSDGKVFTGQATITDITNGIITYILSTDDLGYKGLATATIELFGADEHRATSNQFTFTVRAELNYGNGVVSTNDFPTLSSLIEAGNNEPIRIENEDVRIENETTRQSQETQRQTNEVTRTQGYQNMIQDSYMIPKSPVATYNDIATTYPSPVNGWNTRAIDTGKLYRYNSNTLTWDWIDTITSSSYDILLNEFTASQYSDLLTQTASIFTTGKGKNTSGADVDVSANVLNGQFSVLNIGGRTYTNRLGSKGDCENTTDFTAGGATLALDSERIFGEKSILAISTGSVGGFGGTLDVSIDNTKYYFVSGYIKNINAVDIRVRVLKIDNTLIKDSYVVNTTSYGRLGLLLQPSDLTSLTAIRVSCRGTASAVGQQFKFDGVMVQEITASEYTEGFEALSIKYPYINGTKSTLNGRISVINKNLLPSCDDLSEWEIGDIVQSDGANFDSAPTVVRSKKKKNIAPNTTYIYSVKTGYTGMSIFFYDKNGNFVGGLFGISTSFTTPTNAYYFRVRFRRTDSANITNLSTELSLALPQVELGSSVTSYVKHENNKVYYTLPTGEKLNSLPNGTKDVIDVVKGTYTKKIKPKVLDGSVNVAYNTRSGSYVYIVFNSVVSDSVTSAIEGAATCYNDTFNFRQVTGGVVEEPVFNLTTTRNLYVSLPDSATGWNGATPTVGQIQTYLTAHPITLNYHLMTSQITKNGENGFSVEGTPFAYKNGTFIIEAYHKKELTYSTASGGLVFDYPISSIEKIMKIVDGSYQEITFTPTIASDGLSATIDELVDTDIVTVYAPYKTEESTIPTTSYKVSLNKSAQLDQATITGQKNSEAIVELKDIIDILLRM